ncbi:MULTISPECIES: glycosyltransferase family 4 protein [unclassified Lactococcus]|uniref:glycosyltransferase family 4 protein n=1 Tax=unclassified Lactococcus TaxID=2643510 RepID=UPI0011CCCB36|nr:MULTISPECIES: glycosyltransferase family 4 protein [unclassified Lactococcus]MQW23604.1 glycosyltransferase [Lactococcus sp. dk101]TXK37708.1 glycosyltransferase family 4 protein [Lactococcus sp. dk310]TXK49208.1 glycosyltransferase family 4 protein [Lactococcus sp. dk322]
MKILLYLGAEDFLSHSGIGRAMKHQQRALDLMHIDWTKDPNDDYDILHLNTYSPNSWKILKQAKKEGKKVIFHGHSTKEDFQNSFLLSNFIAPLFKMYLLRFYRAADLIITPTEYSKSLIRSYGIECPIIPISNGIDLAKYSRSEKKEEAFRQHFNIKAGEKVVITAGLYFMRKGIDDFVKVAEKMPDVRFIWFGYQNLWTIPGKVRRIVKKKHPKNVEFPGYISGDVFEGAMTAADCFFFPSREETEGIVVLEALASHQKVVVRDIPVYNGWLDDNSSAMASDVDGFVAALQDVLYNNLDKTAAGYEVAQSRSIEKSAEQLLEAYKQAYNQ